MTKKLVLVETIIMTKMQYVIECDEVDHALDEVTMIDSGNPGDYFPEVSQTGLGETISGYREITAKGFKDLLKEVEHKKNGSYWMGEELIRKIKYMSNDLS